MSNALIVRAMRALANAPYLLLTFTAVLWAGNLVLGRYAAGHIPPFTLATVRWIGATLILLPFAARDLMRDWPVIRRNFWLLVMLSATGIACYNAMSYYGLQYTQAINGLLVQSTSPLLIALWTFVLFRERLSLGQMAGVVTSLAGVVVIISRGDADVLLHLKPNIGDVWIIAALAVYCFYTAALRWRPPLSSLSFLAVIMGLGAILLIPAALWEAAQGRVMVADRMTISVVAYVMTGPSLLAYLCFNRGIELVGANRAAPFFHLMPVFGSALAIVFLGERMEWYHAAGYLLVLGGIVIATRAKGARPATAGAAEPQGGRGR